MINIKFYIQLSFSVHVTIMEKISLQANRDGGLESLEVKGDLELTISDPNLTKIKMSVRADDESAVQFKVIIF